ncbi:cytochrome ubiquinol oxidase subunit I [Cupriavidus basilensis]
MLALFGLSFWSTCCGRSARRRHGCCAGAVDASGTVIAIELGWVVAEYGRQPWTIYGVLPTHRRADVERGQSSRVAMGFIGFYTLPLIVEMYPMIRFARQGPGSLGTGRYDFEAAHVEENAMFDYPTLKVIWWLLIGAYC